MIRIIEKEQHICNLSLGARYKGDVFGRESNQSFELEPCDIAPSIVSAAPEKCASETHQLPEGMDWTLVKEESNHVFMIWDTCINCIALVYNIQVVPGRAGGGSFRRKKKYIAKKEFAYRMFARRPTIFLV